MLCVTVQHQNNKLDLGAMSGSLDVNGPLHQASAWTLRWRLQHCSHWPQCSRSNMTCNPILKHLHCGQWDCVTSVIAAVTLMFGVRAHLHPLTAMSLRHPSEINSMHSGLYCYIWQKWRGCDITPKWLCNPFGSEVADASLSLYANGPSQSCPIFPELNWPNVTI